MKSLRVCTLAPAGSSKPLQTRFSTGIRVRRQAILSSQSIGECVLRSAGRVEQTFGGITSNLWDDPFEWTLPETLSSRARIVEYLTEVEQTRKHAFGCFAGDADLLKKIATPSGEMSPLINLLLDTLARALNYQGRAVALQATLSNTRPAEYH